MTARAAAVLWTLSLAVAGGGVAVVLTSDHAATPVATAIIAGSVGLAYVGAGLVAWLGRPESRIGALMTATGFAWFLGALTTADGDVAFTAGSALNVLALGFFAWLVLAFPSGRLLTNTNRGLAALALALATVGQVAIMLFADAETLGCDGDCPSNLLLVERNETAAVAVGAVVTAAGLVLVGWVTWIVVRRLRVASPALRRAIAPFFLASAAALVLLGAVLAVGPVSEDAAEALNWVMLIALLSVPLAFLYGLVRERIARSASRLVVQLAGDRTPEIQEELQRTLGDPTLRIAYWLVDERIWVDIQGRPVPPPETHGNRFATTVERNEQPVAVLEHDVALLERRDLLDAVASASGLALENERRLQELRRSEARNRALLGALPDLMFRIDTEGRYLDFKAESDRDLFDPEVIGRTVHERLPADVAEAIMRAGRRALEARQAQTFVYELEFPDGSLRSYEGRAVASGNGEFLLIVRDFTERLRGEQELRASEARNRALLGAVPDLLFRIGRDGRYRDFKADDPSQLYTPPETLIGSHVRDLLPRTVADRIMRAAERAFAEGAVQSIEYQLELGGEPRYFEGRIAPSGEDEFVLIVRDFTDRRRQEEELRLLHRQLELRLIELERERDFTRTVVNTAPSILILVDAEGQVIRLNTTAKRLTGYDDDEALGVPFWELLVDPALAAEAEESFEVLREGEDLPELEQTWLTRAGTELVVAWSGQRLTDERGHLRFVIAGQDVTERTRQQAELRASRARIVEAGDAARRRLERNLHDGAQQRLVSLSLALRLAQSRLSSDPEGAEQLLNAAREELALALEELRELARGIHPAILTERGLGAALEALASRSPVPVELDTPRERLPEPVEAAAYYVVSEALANVAKYAQASTVRIRVERENGRALVVVADDGVGGADPMRGSGLRGLADRVEALAGRLEVESRPGTGTHVRAEIPVS